VALVAHDQATEVTQPGKEPLDLSASLVPAQRATILRLESNAAAPRRRDHLNAKVGQRGIEWIGIVGTIADEPSRQLGYEAGIEGRSDESHLVMRSRGGTGGERKTKTVCHCHELRPFAPLGRSHTFAPFFRHHKRAVDETFREIEFAPLFEIAGHCLLYPLERALTHPALEAAVAGLVRRLPLRQIRPLGSGSQNPENPIEHLATAASRSPASVGAPRHLANQWLDHLPLFVRHVHCCILLEDTAYHPFMR
jgi:hypothetical protein